MTDKPIQAGMSLVEASQAVLGKTGRKLVIFGLMVIMILFELDNSTISVYSNYATSEFGALSALGSLNTASMIAFGVVKLPIAKLSNIIGRGYTLAITISLYTVSYILMASASGIQLYAAGMVLYKIGQSATNVMTTVIISDITSLRWRGLAIGASYFPYLITPWVSGFIVDSVISGIGWRWGVGIFAILMPFGASVIIGTLIYYQQRAKAAGLIAVKTNTIHSFCSDIDLGGVALFVTGFSLLLLPITIAGSLAHGWNNPWVISLIILGFVILLVLPVYEKFVAGNPMVPVFYFQNATIVFSILLISTDSLSYFCTHTYLYAWAVVSHNLSARDATFFNFTNGVTQCLAGIFAGGVMLATSRYKWLVMGGAVVRLIGYGLMIRLRGQQSSIAELFIQQVIQGVGSGIIHTSLLVPPQASVPNDQIAQVLSLTLSCAVLGGSVGSAIAGGVYTNTLRPSLWKYLGGDSTPELVDELYNSITGVLPDWGTPERVAVNFAYTDVMRNFVYIAVGVSVLTILMCFFLPDIPLPKTHTALFNHRGLKEEAENPQERK
ncbi:MFS general substrate transporter [Xylaria castorea]|nr:MFS general substrate transporter [Xylaria castorea]